MDSSDEDDCLILLLLRRRKRKRHRRETRGEFHRTFRYLLDNPDEELFFNYTRMSYRTYDALKTLVLKHLQPGQTDWRKSIEAEQNCAFWSLSL
ncbi:hypothetical protein ACOMHN_027307 [Nucella lapillus]